MKLRPAIIFPKVRFLHELIEFAHSDKPPDVKRYIMETMANTTDSYKGVLWEKGLDKGMYTHTTLLGGSTPHLDFTDTTDAKWGTFYQILDKNGKLRWQCSISNFHTKIGPLRVCLCVPGLLYHKLYFLFIPHEAYITYKSKALKFGLSPAGKPTHPLMRYEVDSFEQVCQPYVPK